MSIIAIIGKPRTGKTALVTLFGSNKMLDDSFDDYVDSKREIKSLNDGGFNYLEPPPSNHLVFSDYRISINKRLQSYYVDGFKIGLPNPFFETMLIPPYSTLIFDEAQRYWNSRMSKYLREEVYHWFQLHGQNHYKIYMTCQRFETIDINIRALVDKIIVIEDLKIKEDKYGRVKKMIWTTREFTSSDVAEQYCMQKDKKEISKLGEKNTYKTNLPIFDYYDSFGCKPAFYNNRYYEKFEYLKEQKYDLKLEDFIEYNGTHSFSAPKGFWKNIDYDKKVLKDLERKYGN